MREPYEQTFDVAAKYWNAYGGARAFASSPFTHLALFATVICFPAWIRGNWWEISFSLLPALVGFVVAAFAVVVAVGDEAFRKRLSTTSVSGGSASLSATTALVHFLIVQCLALFLALVASGRPLVFVFEWVGVDPKDASFALRFGALAFRAIGFFLLCYSLASCIAIALRLFRLSYTYQAWVDSIKANQAKP